MRDLNAYPLDLPFLCCLRGQPLRTRGQLVLRDATLRVSGPLFQLPGGALTVSSLAEHREEGVRDSF